MIPSHSTNNTTSYTCISCHIQFPSTELQRFHMKTEWHRYNLKRRVAQLAPVTHEIFQLKVTNSKESVKYDDFGFAIEEEPVSKKKNKPRYDLLQRGRLSKANAVNTKTENIQSSRGTSPASSVHSEFSLGTLKSHSDYGYDTDYMDNIRSNNSIGAIVDSDYQTEEYETEEYETDFETQEDIESSAPLELDECFYCGIKSESIEDNLSHLITNHNLYVPNLKYLADKEGLIRFLSDIVIVQRQCIKCDYQSKKLIGIRQHIIAKGHACIPYESKEERELFNQFYDFQEDMNDVNEEDEGVDTGYTSGDDSEYTVANVDPLGVELALPNGYKLGHRSMARYYRQNLPKSERRLSEGEQTVMVINKENERMLHLQEVTKHNEEVKRTTLITNRIRNKALSNNKLKYGNNQEYYVNQKLG